jgi:hypothetical protein
VTANTFLMKSMCEYGQIKRVFKEIGSFTLGKLMSVFASTEAQEHHVN